MTRENDNKHIDIRSLVSSGAKIKRSERNHHFRPCFTNVCAVADCLFNDGRNYFDPDIVDMLKCLVKSILQHIKEGDKWVEIQNKLSSRCTWNNAEHDIINLYLYNYRNMLY